jgi:hypothetical protein
MLNSLRSPSGHGVSRLQIEIGRVLLDPGRRVARIVETASRQRVVVGDGRFRSDGPIGQNELLLQVVPRDVASAAKLTKNTSMSTETSRTAEGIKDLQDAVERLIKGIRDPEIIRKACDDMDRMREETRQRIGTVEVAVELIRDARNQ